MKPPVPPEDTGMNRPVVFCTECGAELENFCFSEGVKNVEAIRKTLAQCRSSGKFRGEFCSKLFVAQQQPPPSFEDDPD